jgi:hypothetical protein
MAPREEIKVRSLGTSSFGNPDLLIMDEPY